MASVDDKIIEWNNKRRQDTDWFNNFKEDPMYNPSKNNVPATITTNHYGSYLECDTFNVGTTLQPNDSGDTTYTIRELKWLLLDDYPYGISIDINSGNVGNRLIMLDFQVDVYRPDRVNFRLNQDGSNWSSCPRVLVPHRKTYNCHVVCCTTVDETVTTTTETSSGSDDGSTTTSTSTSTITYKCYVEANIPIELRKDNDITNMVYLGLYVDGIEDIIICRDMEVVTLKREVPINGKNYGRDAIDEIYAKHPGPFKRCPFS